MEWYLKGWNVENIHALIESEKFKHSHTPHSGSDSCHMNYKVYEKSNRLSTSSSKVLDNTEYFKTLGINFSKVFFLFN